MVSEQRWKTGERQNSVECVIRGACSLSTVHNLTLQKGPLWNANGNGPENFHFYLCAGVEVYGLRGSK
jgi:hypothetical protein